MEWETCTHAKQFMGMSLTITTKRNALGVEQVTGFTGNEVPPYSSRWYVVPPIVGLLLSDAFRRLDVADGSSSSGGGGGGGGGGGDGPVDGKPLLSMVYESSPLASYLTPSDVRAVGTAAMLYSESSRLLVTAYWVVKEDCGYNFGFLVSGIIARFVRCADRSGVVDRQLFDDRVAAVFAVYGGSTLVGFPRTREEAEDVKRLMDAVFFAGDGTMTRDIERRANALPKPPASFQHRTDYAMSVHRHGTTASLYPDEAAVEAAEEAVREASRMLASAKRALKLKKK